MNISSNMQWALILIAMVIWGSVLAVSVGGLLLHIIMR